MRYAAAILISVLTGVGAPVAAPFDMPVQPEMAPARGEPQVSPKFSGQARGQEQTQKPAGRSGELQDRQPSETTGGPTKAPKTSPSNSASSSPPSPRPSSTAGREMAGDRQQAAEPHRYSFHRVKDDILRLDLRTGEVTQCSWRETGWSCKTVPDERAALESEIARLQRENAALKNSLLTRGIALPEGVKPELFADKGGAPPPKTPEAAPAPKLPEAADLDRAIGFIKGVWRRLLEMMVELQREIQQKS